MTDENSDFSVIDTPGYGLVYDAIANFIHGTPHPPRAAGAVLNAICAVGLTVMSAEALADLLRRSADAAPAEAAKAKGRLT